jgi:exfoliative toxin A/B
VPSWLFALQHVETTFAFVMVMYVMFRFAKQAIDQWRRTGRVSGV